MGPGSLLIVTGPPGAGKSTTAALLAERLDPSVLVEGDAFFRFLATGAIEPWLLESQQQNEVVTDVAARATAGFVEGGYHTVYDGVMGWWFLPTFARSMGVEQFDYAVILPPLATCLDRVATRSGHGFNDAAAARSMHEQFAAVDIDPRFTIADDAASTGDIVEQIMGRRERGELRIDAASL